MITIKEFPAMTFESKSEAIKHLIENKEVIKAQKKCITKEADAVWYSPTIEATTIKSEGNAKELEAKLVINTTNVMDSHSDVHIKGIWKKSVSERKGLLLLQEHKMTFDSIITDKIKAEVIELSFSDLGYKSDMTTEALVFNATITPERNQYMFNQYSKGYVKEHSVGMRYVNIDLAVSPELEKDEDSNKVWNKYIDQILNKEDAEEQGYFWAVTEAKIIEGSAVVKGSNSITPVLSIEPSNHSTKIEPTKVTQHEQFLKTILNKQ